MIKKQFGKSVLVEEVDKMMQEKVNEYIRDNKVNMLGMPLPNEEKMKPIDFDTQEDFDVSEDQQAEIPQPLPANRWHHSLPFRPHDL